MFRPDTIMFRYLLKFITFLNFLRITGRLQELRRSLTSDGNEEKDVFRADLSVKWRLGRKGTYDEYDAWLTMKTKQQKERSCPTSSPTTSIQQKLGRPVSRCQILRDQPKEQVKSTNATGDTNGEHELLSKISPGRDQHFNLRNKRHNFKSAEQGIKPSRLVMMDDRVKALKSNTIRNKIELKETCWRKRKMYPFWEFRQNESFPTQSFLVYPATPDFISSPAQSQPAINQWPMRGERNRYASFAHSATATHAWPIRLASRGFFFCPSDGNIKCFCCDYPAPRHSETCDWPIYNVPFASSDMPPLDPQVGLQRLGVILRPDCRRLDQRSERLETLRQYFLLPVSTGLAEAGFYAGNADFVRCFSCGLQLSRDMARELARGTRLSLRFVRVHKDRSPQCDFVKQFLEKPGSNPTTLSPRP